MAQYTKDMTSGKPIRLILQMALPLMLGSVFHHVYIATDAIILGNAVGVKALAAVGAADWPMWLIVGVLVGFTHGFAIPVARRFGRGDMDGMRKSVCMAFALSACMAAVLTALTMSLMWPFLRALGTPDDVIGQAYGYLMVYFGGIILMTAYNMQAAVLRALGNGRTPLYALAAASLLNIALDLLFILAFGWGIFGAAAATILANACSSLICYRAIRRTEVLRITKADWKADWVEVRTLARLATPIGLQNGIIGVGGIFVQRVVNSNGMTFIAGYTAINKIYGLLELAGMSIGFAMTTYVGQNVGGGDFARVRRGVRSSLLLSVAIAAALAAAMVAFGGDLASLFISDEPELKALAVDVSYAYLSNMSLFFPILYVLHVYRASLYGLGDTVIPMVSGGMEMAMRIAAVLLVPALMPGVNGVYICEPAAWLGAVGILAPVYYYRAKRKAVSF